MSSEIAWILSIGWVLGAMVMLLRVRRPGALAEGRGGGAFVSVIVPARNEARSIERCLDSIAASDYDDFEIIVVNDQSTDGTGTLARRVAPGRAQGLRVVEGTDVPTGWLGKPWACHQGSQMARGDLLLFTDADTWHHPTLLGRAVSTLEEEQAHAITVLGKQEMDTFWEKVVQPQVFFGMAQVFRDMGRRLEVGDWRRAIANGQYLLFRRDAYDGFGGHVAVRGEVAEDLRLAQIMTREGYTLAMRHDRDLFATRMYRSLSELVSGWSKNTALGARAVVGSLGGAAMFLGALVMAPLAWILPSIVLIMAAFGVVDGPTLAWAGVAYGVGSVQWALVSRFLDVPAPFGLLHPLGTLVVSYIALKSLLRGTRVEWKGRRYQVERPT